MINDVITCDHDCWHVAGEWAGDAIFRFVLACVRFMMLFETQQGPGLS